MTILSHHNHSESSKTHPAGEVNLDSEDPEPSKSFMLDEGALIKQFASIFASLAPQLAPPSYHDDCATLNLAPPNHSQILVTTDALCEGVHFDLQWDNYHQVGAQAAVVNLSDLASSGAQPIGLLWSLSIPSELGREALNELASGFGAMAGQYDCPIIGGNLCVRPGHLEIHVTALGRPFTQPIHRGGASEGDLVYVTGTLGARALGYLDPTPQTRTLRHQWRPHLAEAEVLARWGKVSAMLDVSDGLLLDAERLAQESGVTIALHQDAFPLCEVVRNHHLGVQAALSGGEDYVLLFTAPAHLTLPSEIQATCIGHCLAQSHSSSPIYLTLDGIPWVGEGHLYRVKCER